MIYVHVIGYTYNYSRFRVLLSCIIYTLSECLVLYCRTEVLKEGGKKIKPQDMLEDIPDEIIDMDISGLFKGHLNTGSMGATEGYR